MNEKVLNTLEYHKITAVLTEMAGSAPGKEKCRKLLPMEELALIETAQDETAQALEMIIKAGAPSFSGNRDLGPSIARLRVGAALSAAELLHIVSLLECARRVRSYGKSAPGKNNTSDSAGRIIPDGSPRASRIGNPETDAPEEKDASEEKGDTSVISMMESLDPIPSLSSEISRCILEEDVIADDASPGLRKIRKEQATTNGRIHTQLSSMLNGSLRTYLQDAVITMRGDRYCLPVKAEYKSQVPGMIHDQSSTGSTFFIEPSAVVNLNNRLRELALEEKNEIQRILQDLSLMAAEHTDTIKSDTELLTELDFIFAKGNLALKYNATRPIYHNDRHIKIRRGRHPLLDPKTVVPIDIELGRDFDLLIITGPNTGGKTVALKTLGLFVLMGQAGLHIPAGDRSELSYFREVYADIGDEQSIEQNLSTFSSHMTNTVSILKKADYSSLCLFDEPGAGTDPTEGAALAMAILDHLHKKGIRTMATTHYSEIKVYALQTKGVENACCEFNVETLRPTYRLLIGIPGKSNAFAISSRLGLPEEIIDNARGRISEENESFEELLTRLENDRATMEADRIQIASYKEETERLKKKIQQKQESIEASREKVLRKANEEAAAILKEAKEIADETIKTFRKAGPNASMKDLEKARDKVRGKLSEKQKKNTVLKGAPEPSGGIVKKPEDLKKGDSVLVKSMGVRGIVISDPDRKGNVQVRCGIINSSVHFTDLLITGEEDAATAIKKTPAPKSSGHVGMGKAMTVTSEINLLGMRVDEAIMELDKYLDDATLAHMGSVRVVHGKGTGALRNAVHSHLRRVKSVDSFRLGEFGEGDAGVTIVTFK